MKKLFLILFLIILPFSVHAGVPILGGGTPTGAYTDYTQDANCMGAWFMNGAGTETDRTTNGNDLIETSGTIPTSGTVPSGYTGTSRDFEVGDSEYLAIGDGTELDISGADAKLSIVGWIKVEDVPVLDGVMGIVCKYNATGDQRQYQLVLQGTGSSQFKFGANLSKDSTSGATPPDSVLSTTTTYVGTTWYHIAFVYNDTDMRIYVNGALDCTPVGKTDGIFDGNQNFVIGALSSVGSYFDGLIDEVAVFNRDLSATEVLDIYTNGIQGNKGAGD